MPETPENEFDYELDTDILNACITTGDHMTQVDEDGFCIFCQKREEADEQVHA